MLTGLQLVFKGIFPDDDTGLRGRHAHGHNAGQGCLAYILNGQAHGDGIAGGRFRQLQTAAQDTRRHLVRGQYIRDIPPGAHPDADRRAGHRCEGSPCPTRVNLREE